MNKTDCKHAKTKGEVVGKPKRSKRQHWQVFTWEVRCVDCGRVIKKPYTIAK